MDKVLRRLTDEEAQAETYRYWRSRPPAERAEATWQLSQDLYRAYYRERGVDCDDPGSARVFAWVKRPRK